MTYITQRHRISVKRVQNYKYKIAIFEPACFALVVFYPRLHKRITGCMKEIEFKGIGIADEIIKPSTQV